MRTRTKHLKKLPASVGLTYKCKVKAYFYVIQLKKAFVCSIMTVQKTIRGKDYDGRADCKTIVKTI